MFKILLPLNVFAIDVCKNKHIMSFFGSALVASTLTLFVYELNQPTTNSLSLYVRIVDLLKEEECYMRRMRTVLLLTLTKRNNKSLSSIMSDNQ